MKFYVKFDLNFKKRRKNFVKIRILTHLATRGCSDVVTTSLYVSPTCAGTSELKHPATSRWNVAKTSQWYVSTTSCWNVVSTSQEDATTTPHRCFSSTSQTSLKWNTQGRLSGTSPGRLSSTYLWRPISTSLRRLLQVPNETLNNVAVVRLHHFSELRCCDVLLIGLYYIFKLLCLELNPVGF